MRVLLHLLGPNYRPVQITDDLRVLSAIRQLKPSTAVILMTSYGNPELLERAKRLGAFDTVDKPFEIAALVPMVEHASRITPPRRGGRV